MTLRECGVSQNSNTFSVDSYNAWCRRNGKHSTSAHPNVDWNAQIIQKMRMEVAFEWDILEEEIPTLFGKLTKDVCTEFTWFKEDTVLRKYPQDSVV
jgi:hypothetical protein